MRNLLSASIGLALLALLSSPALGYAGWFETDRLGYTGTIYQYGSLEDAQEQENLVETIDLGDRDASISVGTDQENIVMGSWWYSNYPQDEGGPGWGNEHGNTGVGFMQLYDSDSSSDTSVDMAFGGWDGSYWTDFTLALEGGNAPYASEYSRLSAYANTDDGGEWIEYGLNLTVTGLEGTETSPGVIEAFKHPTGVTGAFTGLFHDNAGSHEGFYVVDFELNMTNWAWDQQEGGTLTYPESGEIYDSYFATVPEPGSIALWSLLGLVGVGSWIRRKRS